MAQDKVLIWGGGGREHALARQLAQKSQDIARIFYSKENAGIADIKSPSGETITRYTPLSSLEEAVTFAKDNAIALTVFGPEAPLVEGAVDMFTAAGLKAFGPTRKAAQLEGSKAWTKERLKEWGVPTADFKIFSDPQKAMDYVEQRGVPIVVKADGLAAGKGAIVCTDVGDALLAIDQIMQEKKFGDAGKRVVVEDFLRGEEASILAFVDGETIRPLVTTQDHKPAYDNDEGPNTGGMGAYGPAPVVTAEVLEKVMGKILKPTVEGMAERGTPFKGCLYAGLMIDKEGNPSVVEYNIRFGDPEAQPTVMLTKTDFYPLMHACIDGTLDQHEIVTEDGAACCVVMASPGYPAKYEKGKEITGLDAAAEDENVVVFHSGTKKSGDKIVTAGGRVLGVTAYGGDFKQAIDRAYAAVGKINFEGGAMYRSDIGQKAINRGE